MREMEGYMNDDYVRHIAMSITHDFHLFFTNKGRVYKIKVMQIKPRRHQDSKGTPISKGLLNLKDETLASFTKY